MKTAIDKLTVTLFLSPWHNFFHGSHLLTGLLKLSSLGEIDLRFAPDRLDAIRFDSISFHMEIFDPSVDRGYRIAVDLNDLPTYLPVRHLECDVIVKRSLRRNLSTAAISPRSPDAAKIIPFGVNFPCRNSDLIAMWLRQVIPNMFLELCSSPGRVAAELPDQSFVIKQLFKSVTIDAFERPPHDACDPIVFYQTSVRDPNSLNYPYIDALNFERVDLIRSLRSNLKTRFVGGLSISPYATSEYPDLVLSKSIGQRDFLNSVHKSLICLSTNGLYGSLPFKIGEYIAASRCILSKPLEVELPQPLVDRTHYYSFTDPDQCVQSCLELIENPITVNAMRHAAYDYYRLYVEPGAHVRQMIKHCLDTANNR